MGAAIDLLAIKEQQKEKHSGYEYRIFICGGSSCSSSDSREVYSELLKELERQGMAEKVEVIRTGCHGLCGKGPIMTVYPDGITYAGVNPDNMEQIVDDHLIHHEPVNRLIYTNLEMTPDGPAPVPLTMSKFETDQEKTIFSNCGKIDPENIEDYIAADGYQALEKALQMKPQEIIDTIRDSGLRGRGGGGFSTGSKWQAAADEDSKLKYVFCNADEGDLGAYMDRSLLEADPHSVIEAMIIAGYAIGAQQGYIYTRPEYSVAVSRVNIALEQAREKGLLGRNIMGSGYSFDIQIRLSAGAYICGEETAMMNSFEQARGEAKLKIVYPSKEGLFEMPTVINNVETYASITRIIRYGADWYKKLGNATDHGTKIFALGGNLNNQGLVEVPLGTTLRILVEDIGGGMKGGKKLKAVQTGGASGGYIPASMLDIEMDYDKLQEAGTLMGAGGLMALDEDTCIVDNTKYQVEFSMKESCGKCTACRLGTKRMYEILTKICDGNGTQEDLDKLEHLAHYVKENSVCGLGQAAPNPVLSSLRFFRDEYEAHVQEHTCEAGVCKGLVKYVVDQNMCEGCGVCAASCPERCISEREDETKLVDNERCIACGTCFQLCPVGAIHKK